MPARSMATPTTKYGRLAGVCGEKEGRVDISQDNAAIMVKRPMPIRVRSDTPSEVNSNITLHVSCWFLYLLC